MALSPNTLAPEPYNLLAVALFLAYMGWVLTAVVRLFRTLHMQKAADQGRVVDIDGLGSRLQALEGITRPHLDAIAHACQVSPPNDVPRLCLPVALRLNGLAPTDLSGDGSYRRMGVTFSADASAPFTVQFFWGVDWAAAWNGFYSGGGSAIPTIPAISAISANVGNMLRRGVSPGGQARSQGYASARTGSREGGSLDEGSGTELMSNRTPVSGANGFGGNGFGANGFGAGRSNLLNCLQASSLASSPALPILPDVSAVRVRATFEDGVDVERLRTHVLEHLAQESPPGYPPPPPLVPLIIAIRPERQRGDGSPEALLTFVTFENVAGGALAGAPPPEPEAGANPIPEGAIGSDYMPPSGPLSPASQGQPRAHASQQLSQLAKEFYVCHEVYGLDDQNQPECVICLTEGKDAILLPCRHLCVCRVCLHFINKCPVCRTPFERYLVFDGGSFTPVSPGDEEEGGSGGSPAL